MTQRAVLRHSWVMAVIAFVIPAALHAQGQFVGPSTSGRQAEDRRVDESSRQTQPARQTEAPKPADGQKADTSNKSQSKGDIQRQPEPQRQHEPARQREPQRQAEPSRQNGSDHWKDPGPAWRPVGPAWRDLNERGSVDRPGEDAFRSNPNTYAPRDRSGRRDRDSRRYGNRDKNVYIAVPYPVPYELAPYYPSQLAPEPAQEPAPAAAADDRPLGFLTLRVQPRTAEVFVDGAFAGIVDDFGGRGARQLPAGTHRVEIVAAGFETLTFDVRVPEHDTVTFTRELTPAVERPAQEPVVIPHKALYIVPRCYIGDRPPQTSDMPAGCNLADLRVIP